MQFDFEELMVSWVGKESGNGFHTLTYGRGDPATTVIINDVERG